MSMAAVLGMHVFRDAPRDCSCTCGEMFYDWRRNPAEVQIEHHLHVEERLHAAGFGTVQEAGSQGYQDGYSKGYQKGYADGAALTDGYKVGHNHGFVKGLNHHKEDQS